MKRKKRILTIVLSVCLILILSIPVCAASKYNSSSGQDKFAVPTGGYSLCDYNISLSETYTYNSSTMLNKFSKHSKAHMYKMTYSTTCPSISVGNIKFCNSSGSVLKNFSSYSTEAIMFDGSKYDHGFGYYNSTEVSYSPGTANYSQVIATISCSGALVPTKTHTVKVKLGSS